jgi:hypothetical protein
MPKVIYELILSHDGKHSVSVKSDDPLALKDALPLAKQLQAGLPEFDESPSPAPPINPVSAQQPDLHQREAPSCGIHSTPMTQVQGKHGPFWSWCSYRPARAGIGASASRFSLAKEAASV